MSPKIYGVIERNRFTFVLCLPRFKRRSWITLNSFLLILLNSSGIQFARRLTLTIALYILAAFILTPMVVFALARLWVMVLAPQSIQGSDLHMLKWCIQEQTRAWAGFHITLEPDAPYKEIKREIKENIATDMERPESTYRRGLDLDRRAYVFYEGYTPDDVLQDTLSDAAFFRLADDRNRELIYRFHDQRELIGALFDHTVWDGVRMFNETLAPAIKSKTFDSRWLLGDRYIPIAAEALMLYTLIRMSLRWLTHKPLPLLPNQRQQKLLRHRLYKSEITSLKERAGCKFTAALLARWSHRLYEALPQERSVVRFGLVVGMKSERFRNNYSVLIIDVPRHDDPVVQAKVIQSQMQSRAIEVMPLYHLISLIEVQTTLKKTMVDCLFSPGIFDRGEGPSQYVRDLFLYIMPTSMPMYSFACSLGDEITLSTTWNCPEVSLAQLSSDAEALYEQRDDHVISPIFETAWSQEES